MKMLRKEDIKQEVFDLYDAYAHNKIQRRDFVQKLSVYAVGGITVASLMGFLMPNYETTFLVDKNNPDLDSEFITYNSPKGGGYRQACCFSRFYYNSSRCIESVGRLSG